MNYLSLETCWDEGSFLSQKVEAAEVMFNSEDAVAIQKKSFFYGLQGSSDHRIMCLEQSRINETL